MDNPRHGEELVSTQGDNCGSSSSTQHDEHLFSRHTDSVLCCSIDNTRLAVTGGIDDTAFVWDLNTKHVIFECIGHKESVVAASFSLNSTYVATGDLNGYIQVRNTTTGNRIFEFEIDEINWILWHNTSEFVLLAGTTKGDFWMWNVNDPAAVKTFTSYGSATTAARLQPDGMKAVVSYQDGSVRVFDLKTKQLVLHYLDTNKSEVICMDLNLKKSVLAVGCIDSTVRLLTVGGLKVIGCLNCKTPENLRQRLKVSDQNEDSDDMMDDNEDEAGDDGHQTRDTESFEVIDEYSGVKPEKHEQEEGIDDEEDEDEEYEEGDKNDLDSVESVAFSPCGNFLAAANNSGTVIIWDVSTLATRCELHTGVGVTRAVWTLGGNFITGHLDGSVRVFDNNLTEKKHIAAHKDQILDVSLNGNTLVTASEDRTSRVIHLDRQ